MPMKIVQITDLHIGLEGEDTLGIDVKANLERLLGKVRQLGPDLLVVSGDLCFRDPHLDIYQWVKPRLDALGIPYELISGNHDDPVQLARVFEKTAYVHKGELFFSLPQGKRDILFLDTTYGKVSLDQLRWLERALRKQPGEVLLFMHHPPLFGGVPHMDNQYALQNQEAFAKVVHLHPHQVHIFCGHYHVDKVLHRGNMTVYITPSSFFQIDQHQEDFAIDHKRPGLREIIVDDRGFRTSTFYV